MSPTAVIITVLAYFAVMLTVSWISAHESSNSTFFTGNRKSNWLLVAFAMIGSALSGVTFVSVPGMVGVSGFGYLQMCLGFIAGYLIIARILIPLYYKLNVVSIYQYLENRFGIGAYKTGAIFFFISKILGAAVRLYLVCLTLQLLVFDPLGLPFALNVVISMAILFFYTFKGGVKSVIWIDTLKTLCMIVAVVLCIVFISKDLGLNAKGIFTTIKGSGDLSKVFWFNDHKHPQFFVKQFIGGLFTVIAMTGLDQDMMQRALTCKNHKESSKNMITSVFMQTAVIALFLCLGVLLYRFAAVNGISEAGDKLFPAVATSGKLPFIVGILFILGLVASAYGAGGSALTALTTSFTIDILGIKDKSEEEVKHRRQTVHIFVAIAMGAVLYIFSILNNTSTIDAVYTLASYTYGPILGMFAFGIITKKNVNDKWVPLIAVISPILCLILQTNSEKWFGGYRFSYELLLINAAFVFIGLSLLIKKGKIE